jgi:hypothetical protein
MAVFAGFVRCVLEEPRISPAWCRLIIVFIQVLATAEIILVIKDLYSQISTPPRRLVLVVSDFSSAWNKAVD